MIDARTLARTMLAGIFVAGGTEALRNPKSRTVVAEETGVPIARRLGISEDPVDLVKMNGAVHIVAGTFLALGWMPRLAALVLGATLVPATVGAHAYWKVDEVEERQAQMMQFLKNTAIVGGLMMVALDTGGRPSLFWSARKAAGGAAKMASDAVSNITD